jgi:hypothetical protein
MLRGIAREGKMVLRAHMVRMGDTKMRAKTKSTMRIIEDVFIVRSIKDLKGTATLLLMVQVLCLLVFDI